MPCANHMSQPICCLSLIVTKIEFTALWLEKRILYIDFRLNTQSLIQCNLAIRWTVFSLNTIAITQLWGKGLQCLFMLFAWPILDCVLNTTSHIQWFMGVSWQVASSLLIRNLYNTKYQLADKSRHTDWNVCWHNCCTKRTTDEAALF